MVCSVYLDAFLRLYETLEQEIFLEIWFWHLLTLLVPCSLLFFQYGAQFIALQLFEPSTRQFAMIDKNVHDLLVGRDSQVIRFQHFPLQLGSYFVVGHRCSPCRLWNNDSTEHVIVLDDCCLLDVLVELLQFIFYLARLYILTIAEDDDFLRAASKSDAPHGIENCQISGVQIAVAVNYFPSLFGTIVIAFHQVRSFDAKFTIHQFTINTRQGQS